MGIGVEDEMIPMTWRVSDVVLGRCMPTLFKLARLSSKPIRVQASPNSSCTYTKWYLT